MAKREKAKSRGPRRTSAPLPPAASEGPGPGLPSGRTSDSRPFLSSKAKKRLFPLSSASLRAFLRFAFKQFEIAESQSPRLARGLCSLHSRRSSATRPMADTETPRKPGPASAAWFCHGCWRTHLSAPHPAIFSAPFPGTLLIEFDMFDAFVKFLYILRVACCVNCGHDGANCHESSHIPREWL